MAYPLLKQRKETTDHPENRDTRRMGENLFSYSLRRNFIPRICKELQKLNMKQTNLPISKWANKLNSQFSKRKHEQTYLERDSTLLSMGKVPIRLP